MSGDNGHERPNRVIEFRASNVKKIKAVEIYPEDREIVKFTGQNRQGKSTILDAIFYAIGGKAYIPEVPIREGEKKAEIYIDFGDFRVTRKITKKGNGSLLVKGRDGQPVPSPQTFLSSCLAGNARNPLEFMRLKPVDQVKELKAMLNIKLDRLKIEQIAGTWTRRIVGNEDDPMLFLDNVVKYLAEERTDVNREVKRLSGVIESIKIPKDKEDLKVIPTSALIAERKVLEDQDRENEKIKEKARVLDSELQAMNRDLLFIDRDIKELELKLAALKESRGDLISKIDAKQEEYFEAADKVDTIIPIDFTDIDERIDRLDEDNMIATNIETLKKAKADYKQAENDSARFSDQIEKVKAYKLSLVEQADLPLPGLGFEDGQVIYNGLPLDQASTREEIEISCAICMAQHPRIGILTIDRGWSELDKSGQEVIREYAQRTGAQIWVTQVSEEPGSEGFHIIDGELAAVDGIPLCEDIPDDMSYEQLAGYGSW